MPDKPVSLMNVTLIVHVHDEVIKETLDKHCSGVSVGVFRLRDVSSFSHRCHAGIYGYDSTVTIAKLVKIECVDFHFS